MAIANADALRFFNRLSGRLHLELTEPSHRMNERLMNQIAPTSARVTSVGQAKVVVEHAANARGVFTVRELADAVAETERQSRDGTEWFGGVDVHHRFFEGIHLDTDGVWTIHWGS